MTDSTEGLVSALDFFNGSASKDDEAKPQEHEAEEAEETEAESTGDSEEEEDTATPAVEEKEAKTEPAKGTPEAKEPWTKAAYLDEKAKRQALEERIKQLEQSAAKQQPQEQPKAEQPRDEDEDAPDHTEDPKAYAKWVREQAKQEAMQAVTVAKIEASAEAMRESNPDYEETIAEFGQMVNADPELYKKFVSKANPAKFAYDTVKNARESRRLADPAEKAKWEEDIRKDERAKALAELTPKTATPKPKLPNMPDLLNAASARSGTGAAPRVKSAMEFFKN